MPNRENTHDLTALLGKPLIKIMEPSLLKMDSEDWLTSPDIHEHDLDLSPLAFYDASIFLIANPNIPSSHLFGADILHDSLGLLGSSQESENPLGGTTNNEAATSTQITARPAIKVEGFELTRTVVRRMIPRNQSLDKALEQTCHLYASRGALPGMPDTVNESGQQSDTNRLLIMYTPHVLTQGEMPFYHPLVKGLAYLYDFEPSPAGTGSGTMSIHFLPFTTDIPDQLEHTLRILLNVNIRLAQHSTKNTPDDETKETDLSKDNVVPRHLVSDTYTRLKRLYAKDLCDRWVDTPEPSKHVFEDLAVAAFLIELWWLMYGITPPKEGTSTQKQRKMDDFPGFVDVACGNGILVYVLLMEGYPGCGFDARRRKTWSIFPASVQERLSENIYIPKPFADVLGPVDIGVNTHTGDFPQGTFIISNHADEMTVWTPLIAALACPESPLPFLSIPCCSHSLSGSRYRYPPPKKDTKDHQVQGGEHVEQTPQPASGDLRALRATKEKEKTGDGILNSIYGSLTAKTMSIAEEIGYEVEKAQLRIPSTRNLGVIGARELFTQEWRKKSAHNNLLDYSSGKNTELVQNINKIVERECAMEGGVQASALMWIERAQGLHKGQGKGNPAHG
ncbi:tRNA(Ser) Um(44) 2'-O-methyltransferase [Penicillium cinerascens]|uniref:tRNA (uracil-O(2)-)-methyltransferase n=1 Tax=Penicillium cinerascens TaxID=70096 RepID=A0A9W9SZK9_9EURO|nr:tRNA(Ser) Um(44) 2'-O-methyltransferase [Penicillium cinerascens]KAJ5203721.1 tRNA(Ser) Um(44) 2'-O-methyltransferase [Penicillium cinerascens]